MALAAAGPQIKALWELRSPGFLAVRGLRERGEYGNLRGARREWRVTPGNGFSVEDCGEYGFPQGIQGFWRVCCGRSPRGWGSLQEVSSVGSLGV